MTNVANARWGPPATLGKTLNTQTGQLAVGAAFFPSIDASGMKSKTLICVQTPGDHVESAVLYCTEYLVSIIGRADADIVAGWMLHAGGREQRECEMVALFMNKV